MNDFRDSPIGQVFEQVKHDLPLIQKSVELKDFDGAIQGMDFTIKALTDLRGHMKSAFDAAKKHGIPIHKATPTETTTNERKYG